MRFRFGAELAALDAAAATDVEQLSTVTKQRTALERQITTLERAHSSAEQQRLDEEQARVAERLGRARAELSTLEDRRNETRRRAASLEEKELPASVADLPERIAIQQAQLDRLTRRAKELVPQVEQLREQGGTRRAAARHDRHDHAAARPASPRQAGQVDQREVGSLVRELERLLDDLGCRHRPALPPRPSWQRCGRARGVRAATFEVLAASGVKRAELRQPGRRHQAQR
ncbi:MAG: hypothetical protein U0514_01195 [Candidatus Andersenbacteria bacterium]